ncbi:hypothetical protein [Pelagibacterium sediminicola]|uniref:hypothetical protein n=1 Tax=Pelagibacterium sediminicola TaxID=2248761 RepID=UPI000E31E362|nr:hypothetical protein [Pelagibacterium sediminicola]
MTIGQVTISAADWIASRVSDRMALVAAGQRASLAQQTGSAAIQPSDENTGAQLDRRERERAALAAQESYKRVAQRIKARLANPLPPPEDARPATGRAVPTDALRGTAKFLATVIASEQKSEAPGQPGAAPSRSDPRFGLVEGEPKKAKDRQAASVAEKEAVKEAQIRIALERERALEALNQTPLFETGLWDDLFVADELAEKG